VAIETAVLEHAVGLRRRTVLNVAILTIGCKLNQAESETMARELAAVGCRVTDRAVPADAFIINTCAVTHVAERKARHLVRLARRLSPGARIVVTGCYAETASAEAVEKLGADVVVRNGEKMACPSLLATAAVDVAEGSRLRTRSFVKIQEGCNDVCAFCVVPQTRGRERSVPVEEVLREVRAVEGEGVREVVLTGTQLGAYGRDLGDAGGLVDLMERVLKGTAIPRIRLSSVQPQDVTPELLDLWRDERLCRHFHIALQSGSDGVLAGMRRRYSTREFAAAVELIRARCRDVAITTDVLVGFPGETEEDFGATRGFCREMEFAALHVFPFSARPGTLAAKMPGQVDAKTKRARVQEMIGVGKELRERFLTRFEGSVAEVLFEQRARGGLWEGLTGNYIRVLARSEESLENRLVGVRLERLRDGGFEGVLQPSDEMS
jgi:threonylcarbamoyladenosine tRNA methylthiotransferase MtaB